MKYAFIHSLQSQQTLSRSAHSVHRLCQVLEVARSGYYRWTQLTEPSPRAQADHILLEHIERLDASVRNTYGALKSWKALNAQGVVCGKHRVARVRKQAGIEANRKRRFRIAVEHHKTPQATPDLLNRQFVAYRPNTVWVGDMTSLRTRQGWLHLAMLLDVYSRKIVGWAFGERANSELHNAALLMAISQRKPNPGLIHHTDRGAAYSASVYRELLSEANIVQSMNGRKSAYDNAMAESFFSTLKNELVHHRDFHTRAAARVEVFDYIELFYNRVRIHQSLGYVSPTQFEAQ